MHGGLQTPETTVDSLPDQIQYMRCSCEGRQTGQNLYMVTKSSGYVNTNMTQVINKWFIEKKDYDYDTKMCTTGEMCGHYTQVNGHYTRVNAWRKCGKCESAR